MVTLETDRIGNQLQESSRRQDARPDRRRGAPHRDHRRRGAARAGAPARRGRPDPGERHRPAAAQDAVRRALRRPRRPAGAAGAADPRRRRHPPGPQPAWRSSSRRSSTTCCPLLRTVQPAEAGGHAQRAGHALDGRGDQLGQNLVLVDRYFRRSTPACRPSRRTSPASPTSPTLRRGGAGPGPRAPTAAGHDQHDDRREGGAARRPSSPARPASPTTTADFLRDNERADHPGRAGQPADASQLLAKYAPESTRASPRASSTGCPRANAAFARRHLPHHARDLPASAPATSRARSPRWGEQARAPLLRPARPAGSRRNPFPATTSTTAPSAAATAPAAPFPTFRGAARCRIADVDSGLAGTTEEQQRRRRPARRRRPRRAGPSHPDPARGADAARHGGEHSDEGHALAWSSSSSSRWSPCSPRASSRDDRQHPARRQGHLHGRLQRRDRAWSTGPGGPHRRRPGRRGRRTVAVATRTAPAPTVDVQRAQELASLTQGTQVTIKYRNLVGQRYLALTQGAGAPTRARGRRDDPARRAPTRPSTYRAVQRLQAAVRGAVARATSTSSPARSSGPAGRGRRRQHPARQDGQPDLDPRRPRRGHRPHHRQPQRRARAPSTPTTSSCSQLIDQLQRFVARPRRRPRDDRRAR